MKRKMFYFLIALLILSTGCSKQQEVVKVEPEIEIEEKDVVEEETEAESKELAFDHTYPLTGIGTNDNIDNRAVVITVNNHPKARPQSGLHKADIIYEVLAEGNVTRFVAVYQSEKAEIIGPVRSARDYFIDLTKSFNPFFIAHGWSPKAKQMLEAGEVDNINGLFYDGTLFWRSKDRVAPHNSYISFENIEKGAAKKNYDLTVKPKNYTFLTEEDIANLDGDASNHVTIAYDSSKTWKVEYDYDSQPEKYKRYSAEVQTVDKENKSPVLLDNIFIVEMDHKVIDQAGRRDIDLTSGGKGWLLQKGLKTEVEWKNIEGRIIPFKDGKEIGFVPGKTWINIVPNLKIVTFDEN
ncbi:DUF3048 domain-containing protein [Bacillus luteolus]|uniref:DUF3048 domain-containing protein n=1 Tax=Litchfieldia luteola TaxID=682179 RepID=A0ABR9QFV1_9BACI|nr:DUF3048 domain-containing protein [Cytobacillus luteolus]MBE4907348.1 DUF3048 domain-containing protein [Cytobacillus luteolus]MBP1943896.1 major membrane immunogen (membrane-anchored lipoprotein) [Cytobacillus luteolus]